MSSGKSNKSRNLPEFSIEEYDYWKFRMENHLKAIHDRMEEVLEEGPIKFFHGGTSTGAEAAESRTRQEKKSSELTNDERKVHNLDQVARTEIIETLSKDWIEKVKRCKTAKEMWQTLANVCEGSDQVKEN